SDPVARKPLAILAKLLAECVTTHRIATWALGNEPWDFAAVYYDALDHFSHAFMPFHPPRLACIEPALFELFKDVIEGIYRFHDLMLERLLQLAGNDATVLIASDHGFYSNHLRPGASETTTQRIPNPIAWHRPHGILAMRGPEIRSDERISGASILDLAPTVLTLFGLPIGRDMDGRPLVEAFRRAPKVERIKSWDEVDGDAGMHPSHLRVDPIAQREVMRQMVALGYINPPSEDERANAQSAADDFRFNRAQSLLHSGALDQAIELLEPLAEKYPAEARFLLALAQAFLQSGRLSDARKCIEQAAPNETQASPQRDLLFGILLLAEGRTVEALVRLQRVEATEPRLPRLHNQLGAVYLRARRWEEAESAFRRALEIDNDSAAAWCGLATALLRRHQPVEAAESALHALGLQPFFPAAHFQLGVALARLGWPGRAAQAFEIGLTMRRDARWARRYQAGLRRQLARSGRSQKSSISKRAPAALVSI
ncbi:MAG: tetratricopeptide repeat protein, partial [Chthoniobacterales bacterium]